MKKSYIPLLVAPFLLILLAPTNTTSQTALQPVSSISADRSFVRHRIVREDLAVAAVAAATAINRWKDHTDFPDLANYEIEAAYAARDKVDLIEELSRRLEDLPETANWEECFDTGLLAMAAEGYIEAVTCFTQAFNDPEGATNPFVYAYLGKTCCRLGDVDLAVLNYDEAIRNATSNPPVKFHINFMYAMDLYDIGEVDAAFAEGGPIRSAATSEYALERAFAFYELLLRAWADQDDRGVERYHDSLKRVLRSATAAEESQFESRRYRQATELADRVQKALDGDRVSQMMLAEESCDFDCKKSNYDEVAARLEPWVQSYSLMGYRAWNEEKRDAVSWVWLNYHAAQAIRGHITIAENGLNQLLQYVPIEEHRSKYIEAWLWHGYVLRTQGELTGAATAMAIALNLDSEDSQSDAEGLPVGISQSRILGGKLQYRSRKAFVRQYHDINLLLGAEGGAVQ